MTMELPPGTAWVIPGRLLAGPYPFARDDGRGRAMLRALLDAGVTAFVDLTEAGECPPYETALQAEATQRGALVSYRRLPIPDFGVPDDTHMTTILAAIDEALSAGRAIYVHCRGGIGRTGTVVGCWLVQQGRSGEEALRQVEALLGPGSPETDEQRQLVRRWARRK
jgi:protein-tyrosine phosphatase